MDDVADDAAGLGSIPACRDDPVPPLAQLPPTPRGGGGEVDDVKRGAKDVELVVNHGDCLE